MNALHFLALSHFMIQPSLHLIQFLICSIKSGSSSQKSLEQYQSDHPILWSQLHLSRSGPIPFDSVDYELSLLLERAQRGFPITKNLEGLYVRAYERLELQIEKHVKESPFKALIPLFLFQVPSLVLIFFYPLVDSFLKELQ